MPVDCVLCTARMQKPRGFLLPLPTDPAVLCESCRGLTAAARAPRPDLAMMRMIHPAFRLYVVPARRLA